MTATVRVLALVPYPLGCVPGQRYRIEQWAAALRAANVEPAFAPFMSRHAMDVLYRRGETWKKLQGTAAGYLRRLRDLIRSRKVDVAYVYREVAPLAPAWLEGVLTDGVPIVFDFDDAIYLPDSSPANAWTRALKGPGRVQALCRLARHVTVGNDVLAGFASAHARAVTVVPSTIDTDVYRVEPRPPNPKPVLGWTGSVTTLRHLAALGPALKRLRGQLDYELWVIGGHVGIDGVEVRSQPWRADTEVQDLRAFDVGVMPLPDDEWSRGKCGMKALQYMGLAIPPVVSPVGANATIVEDGVSGFHARDEDEWVDRLARLLTDAALRARLGAAARRVVEERYSSRVHAPRMAQILRQAAA